MRSLCARVWRVSSDGRGIRKDMVRFVVPMTTWDSGNRWNSSSPIRAQVSMMWARVAVLPLSRVKERSRKRLRVTESMAKLM